MKQSKAFMRQKIFGPPRQRTFFSLFCRLRMAGMILYLIQPIGNHKAEVSRIDLKSDEKQTLCTGIPFFSSETTSVLDFVDNKLIFKEDYWSGSRNLTIPVDFTKGG